MASAFICEEVPRALQCVVCNSDISYLKRGPGRFRKMCSDECRRLRNDRSKEPKPCWTCGLPFFPRYGFASQVGDRNAYCSVACRPQNDRRYTSETERKRAEDSRRRSRRYSAEYEEFEALEIFERDGWICKICDLPVDKAIQFPNHMSVSLDHIIPLAKGGGHTRSNTQCSHWICNSRKTHGGGPLHLLTAA